MCVCEENGHGKECYHDHGVFEESYPSTFAHIMCVLIAVCAGSAFHYYRVHYLIPQRQQAEYERYKQPTALYGYDLNGKEMFIANTRGYGEDYGRGLLIPSDDGLAITWKGNYIIKER